MKSIKWLLLFDNWNYKLHLIVLLGENGREECKERES